jgi:hypothetical protein
LRDVGFPEVVPSNIQKMDAVENIPTLLKIEQAAGVAVQPAHFGRFLA